LAFHAVDGGDVLAFTRGSGTVAVVNFGAEPVELPAGEVLLSSVDLVDGRLPSDAAVWLAV
ncbi:MAG: DUF3459 domain-containing protein, partial [Propioniciclava sp.]|nr:DUF3459 domain-containing protein [Propioniciclava sp.]